ncbi:MAG: hypothetical protein KC547_02150, partial [Anaerolineae bacterium]|nr:hypothetical protein [Anaerolineae bacterium]
MTEISVGAPLSGTDGPAGAALEGAATMLRRAANLHTGLAGLLLLLALAAATRLVPGLYDVVRSVFLVRYGGAGDAALAIVVIFALVNISALLVIMVSVLAREIWALPGLVLLLLVNVAVLIAMGYTPGL